MSDEFENRGINEQPAVDDTDFFGDVKPLGSPATTPVATPVEQVAPSFKAEPVAMSATPVAESVAAPAVIPAPVAAAAPVEPVATEATPAVEPAPIAEAVETVTEVHEAPQVQINFDEFQQAIDTHFAAVRNLLKYNKEKDANLSKMSSELQKYRDGYQLSLFKPIAMSVIGYREDCRKSLRDYEERSINKEDACKYIKYLRMDFEDLLENLGIEIDGEAVLYNGKDVNAKVAVPVIDESIPEITAQDIPEGVITSVEDISAYLAEAEKAIVKTITDNSIIDKLMARYIENAKAYEQGIWQVVLYPVIRKIAKAYIGLRNRTENISESITDETGKAAYLGELAYMIYKTEEILYLCGVSIDGFVSDTFDLKKHRLLKTVFTDKEELNGVVSVKHTECYMIEDRVIYPAKVEVYKFKA